MHKDSSQELILCRNVLYHFKDADKQKFLEKAYKVLKPGGYFCIESDRAIQDYDMYLKAGFFQSFHMIIQLFFKNLIMLAKMHISINK